MIIRYTGAPDDIRENLRTRSGPPGNAPAGDGLTRRAAPRRHTSPGDCIPDRLQYGARSGTGFQYAIGFPDISQLNQPATFRGG
jgi:hypothetical protein